MNKFRNSKRVWYTSSLFKETSKDWKDPMCQFTLDIDDWVGSDGKEYLSLYKMYMACDDPTEHKFANECLGGWDHWQRILMNAEVRSYVERWREEMQLKLRSAAIQQLREIAKGDKGATAARYLAEYGWEKKAGRPSKEDVAKQRSHEAGIHLELDEDLERLGINIEH